MVKKSLKQYLLILIISAACFTSGCRVDIFGLFGSTDLSRRFEEKDNFTFLNRMPQLVLGNAYSFILLSDPHIEGGNTWGLEKLIDVVRDNDEIKFVVIAGDITQNAAEQDLLKFIEFADDLALLNVPCYPVIGNHDVYFGNWASWRKLIGSTIYRIDSGETSLLFMDSANAYFGRDQLDWLQGELNSAKRRTFVFTHANPFVDSVIDFQQFTDTAERARFISLLNGRCDYLFTGHVHQRIVSEVGGVKTITVEDFRRNKVYCLVSVKPDGISYTFEEL